MARRTVGAVPANHGHPGNPNLRAFGVGKRVGKAGEPSQTMISSGAASSTPLVRPTATGDGAFARMLDAELPREAPPRAGMRLASFFCCAGGIDLGFRSAGFELAFANDIHDRACETFGRNLGHAPVHRDIRGVGPADYPAAPVDVVTGGFPCVTFSMAGKRMGLTDDINGKLYLELCRVIRELRPRYFVAENVRGMLSANGGAAVKLVLAAFLRLGYRTSYQLVNMAEHGVPQTRERVIFVGVRVDQWRGAFQFPRKTRRLRGDKTAPRWLPPARSLREAIGDLPPPGERIVAATGGENGYIVRAEGEGRSISERKGQRMRGTGEPSPTSTSTHPPHLKVTSHEPNDARVSPTYATTMRVADSASPSPTQVSEAANVVPLVDGMRRMTVRECARVQTFPDWYEFAGGQADGYRLVGNAVPPLYAKRLAEAILEYDKRPLIG